MVVNTNMKIMIVCFYISKGI